MDTVESIYKNVDKNGTVKTKNKMLHIFDVSPSPSLITSSANCVTECLVCDRLELRYPYLKGNLFETNLINKDKKLFVTIVIKNFY